MSSLGYVIISDGGDDRKPSCAQSLAVYRVEDENASRDMLMQCIQTLFSECAPTENGDDHDAAGQCITNARAQTSGRLEERGMIARRTTKAVKMRLRPGSCQSGTGAKVIASLRLSTPSG
jgi:hypothetical protein